MNTTQIVVIGTVVGSFPKVWEGVTTDYVQFQFFADGKMQIIEVKQHEEDHNKYNIGDEVQMPISVSGKAYFKTVPCDIKKVVKKAGDEGK